MWKPIKKNHEYNYGFNDIGRLVGIEEVQIYQLFSQLMCTSLQLSFTLVEILSINKPNSLGGAQNVTRAKISIFKYGAEIDILVPKLSCAISNSPDINFLW